MNKKWVVSNIEKSKYLGILEFQDKKEEFHNFEILETEKKLVFGSSTNVGFFESGYMIKDNSFSTDKNLAELLLDLETYYNEGYNYCNLIVCNECM